MSNLHPVTIPITATETETLTLTTGTTTLVQTVSITSCGLPAGLAKRGKAQTPSPKPSCLNGYPSGVPLSSACKCLSITPCATNVKTVTVTKGQGATTTKTVSVSREPVSPLLGAMLTYSPQVSASATITPTSTAFVTQTSETLVTFTATITENVQATVTGTTTTVFAVPTFSVVVDSGINRGGWFGTQIDVSPIRIADFRNQANAAAWTLVGGQMVLASGPQTGREAVQAPTRDAQDPDLVYVAGTGGLTPAESTSLVCSISQRADGTCPVSCINFAGDNQSFDCGSYWRVGKPSDASANGCWFFTPLAVGSAS